ncbi:hypothetical protein [Anaerovibrio lipolyticus]|nr:hypothetical protein [Anaerovibrio lipolyticus]
MNFWKTIVMENKDVSPSKQDIQQDIDGKKQGLTGGHSAVFRIK